MYRQHKSRGGSALWRKRRMQTWAWMVFGGALIALGIVMGILANSLTWPEPCTRCCNLRYCPSGEESACTDFPPGSAQCHPAHFGLVWSAIIIPIVGVICMIGVAVRIWQGKNCFTRELRPCDYLCPMWWPCMRPTNPLEEAGYEIGNV